MMKSRARCSTLQFEAFFGHFIAVQSQVEWTPSKGWYSVFTATWLLKYTHWFLYLFFFCHFLVPRSLAAPPHQAQPSQPTSPRRCWAGAMEGVGGACIPLKTLTELRFESFASATKRFMRCALLLVVCCGVRLAAVSLYFAKRKDAILWREFRRAQRGWARTEYLLDISFLFEKKSGANHSAHKGQSKQ